MIVHERVNIGLALALDDGLTVPVILDADMCTLEGLAAERLRLADCTRTLRTEEIFAGTFSISNLGPLGVDRFQALVLPPQAAILAVGTLRDTVSLSGSLITAPSTAHRRRASSRRSRGCWPSRGGRSRRPPDQLSRARSGGATRGSSNAGRGRSRWPLAALSPASQAATWSVRPASSCSVRAWLRCSRAAPGRSSASRA